MFLVLSCCLVLDIVILSAAKVNVKFSIITFS